MSAKFDKFNNQILFCSLTLQPAFSARWAQSQSRSCALCADANVLHSHCHLLLFPEFIFFFFFRFFYIRPFVLYRAPHSARTTSSSHVINLRLSHGEGRGGRGTEYRRFMMGTCRPVETTRSFRDSISQLLRTDGPGT